VIVCLAIESSFRRASRSLTILCNAASISWLLGTSSILTDGTDLDRALLIVLRNINAVNAVEDESEDARMSRHRRCIGEDRTEYT